MKHQQMYGNHHIKYGNRQILYCRWFTVCLKEEALILLSLELSQIKVTRYILT